MAACKMNKNTIQMDIKWETTATIKKNTYKIHYPVLHFILFVWTFSALIAVSAINDYFRIFHTAL